MAFELVCSTPDTTWALVWHRYNQSVIGYKSVAAVTEICMLQLACCSALSDSKMSCNYDYPVSLSNIIGILESQIQEGM